MPAPSTHKTLITWRDAKSERPETSGWYTVTHKSKGVIHAYWDCGDHIGFWSDGNQGYHWKITHWAAPSDIQHGKFVSVEAGPPLLLSDIEQLGKGG